MNINHTEDQMTFEPTHITTTAIGSIPSGTPIRVANVESFEDFEDLLGYLGDQPYISYRSDRYGYTLTDERTGRYSPVILPEDYVITDGDRFVAYTNDSGWEPIPDEDTTEPKVTLRFRMSNGDEYTAPPQSLGGIEKSGIMENVSNLNDTRYIEVPLTDNSKVVLNPAHVSSVEVIHNV